MKQPAPADGELILLLQSRDAVLTTVHLKTGGPLSVWNIAWGYDIGDAYAHVTTNISPFVDGTLIDLFSTEDVVKLTDPADATTLWPLA